VRVLRWSSSFVSLVSSFFFFQSSGDHRDLHSFPTRRSSDLRGLETDDAAGVDAQCFAGREGAFHQGAAGVHEGPAVALETLHDRSEEHTSELQSRENLVCRLLLEKKKKKQEGRRK